MENFKPNSHRYKEEQNTSTEEKKKVSKVVKGTVKTKKRSGANKIADVFISEDAHNVGSYILMDVLVPTIKKAIVDMVTDGINMVFFGETRRGKSSSSSASYVSYRSYSDRKDERRSTSYSGTRSGYNYDDIILESRSEAEEVLMRMDELIDTYGTVSVADLYDLVGKSSEYTDNKYGWTNIRNAEPIRVRDGYMLKLPKALPID